MEKLIKILEKILKATNNKLTWEDRIKCDIKWIHYFRNRIVDLSMFVFKFKSDFNNPMQVFKDYPYFFMFTNRSIRLIMI